MPVPESLLRLHQTLGRFLSNPHEWDRICREEQLHRGCRDAVAGGGPECLDLLEKCYTILRSEAARQQLVCGYGRIERKPGDPYPADLARWHGNALALMATAQAALAAKESQCDGDAWPRLLAKWREAACALIGSERLAEANPPSCFVDAPNPQECIGAAARALRGSGWPVEVLSTLVSDPRSRDSGNTVLSKEFPGGVLVMTGANSAGGPALHGGAASVPQRGGRVSRRRGGRG